MTTTMNHPAAAAGKSRTPIIERLNIVTAFALGAISAFVVWRLALQFLPADTEVRLFTREDKITLLSMIAWFVGFMTGIGRVIEMAIMPHDHCAEFIVEFYGSIGIYFHPSSLVSIKV